MRYGGGVSELSIRIKSHYKFTIAAENASYEGYTTEKLLTTFRAHSLPIYWGNKFVGEEFNPEAIIDCSKYDSLDDVVQRVIEIDQDDDLWAYMISRPMQTPEQQKASEQMYQNYKNFMEKIFSQPLDDAVRRPLGFWPSNYERWFIERRTYFDDRRGMLSRLLGLLTKIKHKLLRPDQLPRTDIDDFFNE